MKFSLKAGIERFKDPYFIIALWRWITVLGFIVGIIVGATYAQNFYIGQVNDILTEAMEKDGCFGNYMNHYIMNNPSNFMKNLPTINIYNISNKTIEPND